jgi:hypothetical protein
MQATLCVQLLREEKLKQEIRQGKVGGKETTTEGGGGSWQGRGQLCLYYYFPLNREKI